MPPTGRRSPSSASGAAGTAWGCRCGAGPGPARPPRGGSGSGRHPRVSTCRLGVLAFGDSITNGGGELQWGVALQSWALWTARGLGLPYTGFAVDGATVAGVVEEQIPRFRDSFVHPDARFDVGCVYVGVNDVRSADWDELRFEERLGASLAFLAGRCDR